MAATLPWDALGTPSSGQLSGNRVSASGKWDLWWAVDAQRIPSLVFRMKESLPEAEIQVPLLAGMDVDLQRSTSPQQLRLRLYDKANAHLFHLLCLDVVATAEAEATEQDAVLTAIQRTWRWHYLLARGQSDLMTEFQQKGLIGELICLRDILIPEIGPTSAISAWSGPTGAPKDFEIGAVCIECKARRGAANARVEITSAEQLDTTHLERLFLSVTNLFRSPESDTEAFTIIDLAQAILSDLVHVPDLAHGFIGRLAALGLRLEDDYSSFPWLPGSIEFYEVTPDFPRIQATNLPNGVSHVRYQLALTEIESFGTTREMVISHLHGGNNGHTVLPT